MLGALEARLDSGAAFGMEQVEGDAFGTGGREELNRDDGQPERDVEVLERTRHRLIRSECRSWDYILNGSVRPSTLVK